MALDIRYARNGNVAIAYQVVGDGATDLVFVPDHVSNLVYGWETPHWSDFYERLAQSFRLILFDKRGTGLSDLGGITPRSKRGWRTSTLSSTPPVPNAPSCSVPMTAARSPRSMQRPIPGESAGSRSSTRLRTSTTCGSRRTSSSRCSRT